MNESCANCWTQKFLTQNLSNQGLGQGKGPCTAIVDEEFPMGLSEFRAVGNFLLLTGYSAFFTID